MPIFDFSNPVIVERWQIEFYFDLYHQFLGMQEELIEKSFQEWKQLIREEAQQLDKEEQDSFYEFHINEYENREYSKVILMNSFFAASYALYEHHRNRIKDIFSVKKLRDLEDYDFLNTPEWREIENYHIIRNRIMHEGGKISKCRKETDYAKRKGLGDDHLSYGRYVLTQQFCGEALVNFRQLLLNAITELECKRN